MVGAILTALIEDGSFVSFLRLQLTAFVSREHTATDTYAGHHLLHPHIFSRETRCAGSQRSWPESSDGDLSGPFEHIVAVLEGIDIAISSIFVPNALEQIPLIDAATQTGVKRFVPCNRATPCAEGGIMQIRDVTEQVHDHMFRQRLPFTIIDVGYWYELRFPRVPSGKFDYAAILPLNDVYAGGTTPNMLMAKRDVGRITVRMIKDERTLNKRVYAYGDLLSQNEVNAIVEEKTGEKLELVPVRSNTSLCDDFQSANLKVQRSAEEALANLKAAKAAAETDPANPMNMAGLAIAEYCVSKYVRADNTPENAEYLGYINGRELYPDFAWIKFTDLVDELIAGSVRRPWPQLQQ